MGPIIVKLPSKETVDIGLNLVNKIKKQIVP
jgi:hypothetical protein